MPGVTSVASLAAQSGPTSFVTSDAGGNLAVSQFGPQAIGALDGRVSNLEQSVSGLQQSVTALQQSVRRAYEGTAVAIAMGGVTALPVGSRYSVSANIGTFRGATAFGGGAQFRITPHLVASGALGLGFTEGGVGGRGGLTYDW